MQSLKLFIYSFCLHWVFVAVRGLSLVASSGATLHCDVWVSHCGVFSCCKAQALRHAGFDSCSMWAQ